MPPQSPEEVLAMVQSHLEDYATQNDQLQQFKGRIQGVLWMLDELEEHIDGMETEINPETIGELRSAAEILEDVVDYWIEKTASLRETVQTLSHKIQRTVSPNSLTEIDDDMPETVEKIQTQHERYRECMEGINDEIERGTEILGEVIIGLLDTSESAEMAEMANRTVQRFRELKERHTDQL